ncbi:hypothetical protein WA158_004845 [Blastocystis sp. Blastoise]
MDTIKNSKSITNPNKSLFIEEEPVAIQYKKSSIYDKEIKSLENQLKEVLSSIQEKKEGNAQISHNRQLNYKNYLEASLQQLQNQKQNLNNPMIPSLSNPTENDLQMFYIQLQEEVRSMETSVKVLQEQIDFIRHENNVIQNIYNKLNPINNALKEEKERLLQEKDNQMNTPSSSQNDILELQSDFETLKDANDILKNELRNFITKQYGAIYVGKSHQQIFSKELLKLLTIFINKSLNPSTKTEYLKISELNFSEESINFLLNASIIHKHYSDNDLVQLNDF